MSLVFYWPIYFKLPTPFSGHPESLTAKNGEQQWVIEWGRAVCTVAYTSIPVHVCDGTGLPPFTISVCVNFAWAHSQYELHAWVFTMWISFFLLHMDAHEFVCMYVCVRESMWVSECWICALLWKTGKEGWEANLFLCRLTLSYQTPIFSKTPTISSVCLFSLLLLVPHHSLQFLPYCFCILSVSLLLSVNHATCMGSCVFVWESNRSVAAEAE